MRESDWTPSLVTERDIVERKRRIVRHDWVALTVVPVGMIALVVLLSWLAFAFLDGLIAGLLTIGLIVSTFVIAARVDRRRADLVESSKAPERAIRDEFGGGTGWLVELIVHRGDAPLGADRGMLWVEDGRLMYSGHRTSFALSPAMAELVRDALPVPGVRHGVFLPLRHPAGGLAVSFRPHAEEELPPAALTQLLHHWHTTTRTRQEEGEYPPVVRGPGAPNRAALLALTALGSAYWLGFACFLSTLDVGRLWAYGILGCLGLYYFSPVRVAAFWRAWRDLGRLADRQRQELGVRQDRDP